MAFGKKFSDAMQTGKTDDHSIKAVMPSVPKYEIAEYKLETILETEHGNIHLLGYLDRSRRDPVNGFREYKTGKAPWTQRKADSSGQLTLYNLMIYLKTGKLPLNVNLDWLQTAELEGRIYLTGEITTFSTSRTMQEIVEMANRVKRAALEISEQYNYYLYQAV